MLTSATDGHLAGRSWSDDGPVSQAEGRCTSGLADADVDPTEAGGAAWATQAEIAARRVSGAVLSPQPSPWPVS